MCHESPGDRDPDLQATAPSSEDGTEGITAGAAPARDAKAAQRPRSLQRPRATPKAARPLLLQESLRAEETPRPLPRSPSAPPATRPGRSSRKAPRLALSLGPLPASRNQSSQGMPSGRADLVQSLYAHICCAEASVAEGAAECLASLSALWCRADMRHAQLDGAVNVGGRLPSLCGLELASLSVPSASPTEEAAQATPAASLSTHLSKRLSAVLGDSDHPRSFRCAAADAARAALAAQPGLLTEPTAFVKSAGMGLAGILEEVTPVKDPADAKRFCFVCLALLDGLAAADDSLISSSFESPLESKPSAGISKSHSSMWKLLTKVFSDALRPWLSGKAPWP
eukprot:s49_g16.t1